MHSEIEKEEKLDTESNVRRSICNSLMPCKNMKHSINKTLQKPELG